MATELAPESAGDYEVYWDRLKDSARYHPANRFRYWLIASRLKTYLRPGMSVLDMGCGDARLLDHLRATRPDLRYFGCDVSHAVVALNAKRSPEITFFQADVAAADFVEKAAQAGVRDVDLIVCSEVIEHVEDDRSLLKNLALLLRASGHAILTTQSGPRYRIDVELLHHLRHYRRADLDRMVRDAGLTLNESFNCGFPVLNLQKIIANVMFDAVMKATASSSKPPLYVRIIMNLMFVAMRWSPKAFGPQLVLVAQKS